MSPSPARELHAKLVVERSGDGQQFVRLIAANGEPLMRGETLANGPRARADIITAISDVIYQEDQREYAIQALSSAGSMTKEKAAKVVDEAIAQYEVV